MKSLIRIIGIGGSLGEKSTNLELLKLALQSAEARGAETKWIDVAALDLPMYDPRIEEAPRGARELADAVRGADGLVWASPLYHGTVSGLFKNAIDWLELLGDDGYLAGRPVGLIATAGGTQGLQSINTMEFMVRALRGFAVPLVLPVDRAWQMLDDQGQVRDPKLNAQLDALAEQVVKAARALSPRLQV